MKIDKGRKIQTNPQLTTLEQNDTCSNQSKSILIITASLARNEQTKIKLLQNFAHSIDCINPCNPICAAFRNLSNHSKAHNCNVKKLYMYLYNKLYTHSYYCKLPECNISMCAERKAAWGLITLKRSATWPNPHSLSQ